MLLFALIASMMQDMLSGIQAQIFRESMGLKMDQKMRGITGLIKKHYCCWRAQKSTKTTGIALQTMLEQSQRHSVFTILFVFQWRIVCQRTLRYQMHPCHLDRKAMDIHIQIPMAVLQVFYIIKLLFAPPSEFLSLFSTFCKLCVITSIFNNDNSVYSLSRKSTSKYSTWKPTSVHQFF